MNPAAVFSLANAITLPMWLLMIFLPKWKVTQYLIRAKIIPMLLSGIYVFYIVSALAQGKGMDFGSLSSVMDLFTEEQAVLAGWVHYLAFDLLIGMWILNQNKELKIHQFILALCLVFTFLLGPIGFLLFMLLKALKQKQVICT